MLQDEADGNASEEDDSDDEGVNLTPSCPPNVALARIVGLIEFPTKPPLIKSCQVTLERFCGTITSVFSKATGRWKAEARTQYISEADILAIKEARRRHTPAAKESTFQGSPYLTLLEAEAHKTNAKSQSKRPETKIQECHEVRWISTSFIRPFDVDEQIIPPPVACQICTDVASSLSIWENAFMNGPNPSCGLTAFRICDLLKSSTTAMCSEALSLKHRKLLGVLLACSLVELHGTPWVQRQWRRDMIHLHRYPWDINQLHQLCLRIPCTLSHQPSLELDSETISAFGILIMELEANNQAKWDEESDVDLEYGTLSNQIRLGRVLEEWEDDLTDSYRDIGQACYDFDSHVRTVSTQLGDERHLAVVHKCIVDPLFKSLITDFSSLYRLFEGKSGPWNRLSAAITLTPQKASKRVLFDDHETTASDKRTEYASRFIKGVQPILDETTSSTAAGRRKIRIAVLDSGVDEADTWIRGALRSGRIKDRKSWVDSAEKKIGDSYGHGTIVTQLLLKMAPAAEVYVAKICHAKEINDEFIPGIAEAIKWAVQEWEVNIISLLLGFEGRYQSIEDAVDLAVEKGVLVFAAASNDGALSDRARPARRSDVMCIHASDGLGNPGDMNPTPKPETSNFSTLGVAVPARWKNRDVWKSGTSFATPIAAGFAATLLEFVESVDYDWNLSRDHRRVLYRKRRMEAVFRGKSEKRKEYDFVNLARLWKDNRSDKGVARAIEAIIEKL